LGGICNGVSLRFLALISGLAEHPALGSAQLMGLAVHEELGPAAEDELPLRLLPCTLR